MPANVVKTPADEKKWRKAKRLAATAMHKKKHPRGGHKPRDKWAYTMGIFQHMKEQDEMSQAIDAAVNSVMKGESIEFAVDALLKGEGALDSKKGQQYKNTPDLGKTKPIGGKTKKKKAKKEGLQPLRRPMTEAPGDEMDGAMGYAPGDDDLVGGEGPEDDEPMVSVKIDGRVAYDEEGNLLAVTPGSKVEFVLASEDEVEPDADDEGPELPPDEGDEVD